MAKEDYIQVSKLSHSFGTRQVLHDVSFTVAKGEVLGFLGPNGAGKTTTMRLVSGFIIPPRGVVKLCGTDIALNPERAKAHLGYLPEGAPLWKDMRVGDYLKIMAGLRGLKDKKADVAIERVVADIRLGDVMFQTIHTLSKGYKRRVGLAQAFLTNPDIMILDEPTDGLDPNQKHQMRDFIRQTAKNKAIIVSTHILEEVDELCSKLLLLADGKIRFSGTAKQLAEKAPKGAKNKLEEAFRILSAGANPSASPKKPRATRAKKQAVS